MNFKVTVAAAEQIKRSAEEGSSSDLALRIAAKKKPDGTLEYGMGFDQTGPEDREISSEGIKIIVASVHETLLEGTTMDYVELEEKQFAFIFLNPNDANYTPPTEGQV
jgi:iron-sulfur cluster assembly protein